MPRAVVVLSGGQDSTTCLFWARQRWEGLVAVSFDYGQRHRAELEAARRVAALAGAAHTVLPLEALAALGGSALVSSAPLQGEGGFGDAEAPAGLPTSFVPGRNLVFLALAGALAVREGARDVVLGVCQADYSGYPDCRESFVRAAEEAINQAMPSSCGPLAVHAPLLHLTKAEAVLLARGLPGCWEALAETVTCYEGKRPGCGACPACGLRRKGFAEAGLEDPAS